MNRYRRHGGGGFWRHALFHTQRFARGADNFMRAHGRKIRDVAAAIVPFIAPEAPALAAGIAATAQAGASYADLRDKLERA